MAQSSNKTNDTIDDQLQPSTSSDLLITTNLPPESEKTFNKNDLSFTYQPKSEAWNDSSIKTTVLLELELSSNETNNTTSDQSISSVSKDLNMSTKLPPKITITEGDQLPTRTSNDLLMTTNIALKTEETSNKSDLFVTYQSKSDAWNDFSIMMTVLPEIELSSNETNNTISDQFISNASNDFNMSTNLPPEITASSNQTDDNDTDQSKIGSTSRPSSLTTDTAAEMIPNSMKRNTTTAGPTKRRRKRSSSGSRDKKQRRGAAASFR
jgi:hypothetical protein